MNQSVLAGQPLAVAITYATNGAEVEVPIEDGSFTKSSPLRFIITSPTGARWQYTEDGRTTREELVPEAALARGRPRHVELTLLHGKTSGGVWGPALLTPGSYRMMAEFVVAGLPVIASNAIDVEVAEPSGEDALVLAALKDHWHLLDGTAPSRIPTKFQSSVYFAWARIQELRLQLLDIHNGFDRERGAWLTQQPPGDAQRRKAELFGLVLEEIRRGNWGGQEADALALGRQVARAVGDSDAVAEFSSLLRSKHPESLAAHALEEEPLQTP